MSKNLDNKGLENYKLIWFSNGGYGKSLVKSDYYYDMMNWALRANPHLQPYWIGIDHSNVNDLLEGVCVYPSNALQVAVSRRDTEQVKLLLEMTPRIWIECQFGERQSNLIDHVKYRNTQKEELEYKEIIELLKKCVRTKCNSDDPQIARDWEVYHSVMGEPEVVLVGVENPASVSSGHADGGFWDWWSW